MLIEDLNIIVKVAEFRSITAAAASLDMRTATASAAIKRVEAALGMPLFIRTTRQLRLSSEGERYIPNLEKALLMLELAKQNVKDDLDVVDGEMRLGISSDLGRNVVIPWLDELMAAHQKLTLKVHLTDSNIDFYRDPVDIALRYGSPADSNFYGFKICNVPRILCVSPEYIDRVGKPEHPQELATHNGLFYQLHDLVHDVWQFSAGEQNFKIKMTGDRVSNDGELVRRWCVAGHGVATKSSLDVCDDLLSGRLVSLMPEFTPTATELWLICPSRQLITPAVRLLRDSLQVKCNQRLRKLVDAGLLTEDVLK